MTGRLTLGYRDAVAAGPSVLAPTRGGRPWSWFPPHHGGIPESGSRGVGVWREK